MPKAPDKPLDMDDERVLLAIDLAFAGRHTNAAIAQKCSISPRTYAYWLKHPEFQAALAAKRADFKASIERVTFADKARRIHALNDAALLALGELETRPLLTEVRPTKDGPITNEAFNNTAMAEFRSALADIAAELGERKNPTGAAEAGSIRIHIETDHGNGNGNGGAPTASATVETATATDGDSTE